MFYVSLPNEIKLLLFEFFFERTQLTLSLCCVGGGIHEMQTLVRLIMTAFIFVGGADVKSSIVLTLAELEGRPRIIF